MTATSSSPSCVSPGASATAPVLAQFALYAQADIRIDRAVVMGGDVGVALTNAMTDGRDEVSLEPSGRLDPTRGVFAHTVDLRSQAVMGTVYTTRLDNQGGSFVAVKPFPTVMPSIRALMPIVPGTIAINVASGTTMALQPGAYGAVQVNGTLTLSGGTYQIVSLEIGTAGRVEATSGVQLRIQGHLHLGPSAHLRTNPVGSARDLLVEVAGNDGTTAVIVDSDTELHALVSAPTGTLVFHPRTSARGAFVAHDMQINADALVVYESGFALPLKTCIAQFQISPDKVVPGKDPQDLAHTIAATACLAPDASNCEVAFLAQANFDRRSAAKQLVVGLMTPARYVAVSRDRSRKLLRAQTDPTWLAAFCRGDADGDLVPDDRDTCPGTPSLTATDDHGCTDPNLPRAPDPVAMKKVFDNLGVMISTGCDGAPEPLAPFITDVCLDRPNLRYLITVSQDPRQPSACLVWYQMNTFSIEKGEPNENFNAMLAFERGQAISKTATSVTLPLPLSCNPVETKGDGRSWPCDEANGDPYNTLINARAINGNGQQSPWGQTRQFGFHLCP